MPRHIATTSAAPEGAALPQKSSRNRLSAKLRLALVTLAQEGTTKREAAARAGMNETALGKALRKPYVAAQLDDMKASVAKDIKAMEGHYRTLALEHAWHLAKNAKSEAVQARMVELLAGETRGAPSIALQINNNLGEAKGYEYAPPGAQVVEVRGGLYGSNDTTEDGEASDNNDIDDSAT